MSSCCLSDFTLDMEVAIQYTIPEELPVRFEWTGFERQKREFDDACERVKTALEECPERFHGHLLDWANNPDIDWNKPPAYIELESAANELGKLRHRLWAETGIHDSLFQYEVESYLNPNALELYRQEIDRQKAKYLRLGHKRYLRTLDSGRYLHKSKSRSRP